MSMTAFARAIAYSQGLRQELVPDAEQFAETLLHALVRKVFGAKGLFSSLQSLASRLGDSYWWLRLSCPVVRGRVEERSVSVAIPFYNNAAMGHLALFNILNNEKVSEIVVLDDSSDIDRFEELKRKLSPFSEKLKLFRRNQNWGTLANKLQAVELCQSEWTILLDYDNSLSNEYIDSMFDIPIWNPDSIYCSDFAYPAFDFKELSGATIDFGDACDMAIRGNFNRAFFNDGNYLLNRKKYLEALKPYWRYEVAASDVLFANYMWLSRGNRLEVVPHSRYRHRVHSASTWINTRNDSRQICHHILQAFRQREYPDTGWMDRCMNKKSHDWSEPVSVPLR